MLTGARWMERGSRLAGHWENEMRSRVSSARDSTELCRAGWSSHAVGLKSRLYIKFLIFSALRRSNKAQLWAVVWPTKSNSFTLVRFNAVSSERDLLGKLRDIF